MILKIIILIYSPVRLFLYTLSVKKKRKEKKTSKQEKKPQNTNSGILFTFYSLQLEQSMYLDKKKDVHIISIPW